MSDMAELMRRLEEAAQLLEKSKMFPDLRTAYVSCKVVDGYGELIYEDGYLFTTEVPLTKEEQLLLDAPAVIYFYEMPQMQVWVDEMPPREGGSSIAEYQDDGDADAEADAREKRGE